MISLLLAELDVRVGFALVVFIHRSDVELEHFQFRIRNECSIFVAELLCLSFAIKWITEQNSIVSDYLIRTDSLSSLDSLKCICSSNNLIVEIQKQLKSLKDKNISIDFAFVRGPTGRGGFRYLGAHSGKRFETHGLKNRKPKIVKRFAQLKFSK
ncbi:uncharacterized protein TNCV_4890321 [Trichonephila clavipes]|nr:uncharacterized protein TNCV_4890321 [Trichonephila clavipes]